MKLDYEQIIDAYEYRESVINHEIDGFVQEIFKRTNVLKQLRNEISRLKAIQASEKKEDERIKKHMLQARKNIKPRNLSSAGGTHPETGIEPTIPDA